jgi:hypothetical protein
MQFDLFYVFITYILYEYRRTLSEDDQQETVETRRRPSVLILKALYCNEEYSLAYSWILKISARIWISQNPVTVLHASNSIDQPVEPSPRKHDAQGTNANGDVCLACRVLHLLVWTPDSTVIK